MATWLSAIVNGDEHEDARGGGDRGGKDNNGLCAPSKSSETSVAATKATSMETNDKLPTEVCIICTLYTCMHIFYLCSKRSITSMCARRYSCEFSFSM
jgi:hypothetical protein